MIDSKDDIKLVSGIRGLNRRGNRKGRMSVIFWKAEYRVIEMDGVGDHHCRHATDGPETTTNVQY